MDARKNPSGIRDRNGEPLTPVLLTIPNLHWIHALVVVKAIWMLRDPRYHVTLQMPSNKPFEATLQDCVDLLTEGPYEWWVSMDADNPPERNPLDLIAHGKDVVGCPTPIYHNTLNGERPIYWNAYQFDEQTGLYREYPLKDGLQQVHAIGTGCFVARREVFEHPHLRYGAFQRKWRLGRVERGNDIAFCERARECGFGIWADFNYPAEHMCEIPLNEISRGYNALQENAGRPADADPVKTGAVSRGEQAGPSAAKCGDAHRRNGGG